MTIEIMKYNHFDEALHTLQDMSLKEDIIVFRGQQDIHWRLHTSLARYENEPKVAGSSEIDFLLDQFKTNLAKLGELPFQNDNRLDWLEFAQHHGVPTPYLDFTYSPYVALFFAFNELKDKWDDKADEYVVVYALNVNSLAYHWASVHERFNKEKYRSFLFPAETLFHDGFSKNALQFIPQPGKKNARMQRQQGAFLYDTLQYSSIGVNDLEDYISRIEENTPTLRKIFIHKKCVTEVFQLLELMNITGTMLFLDSSGAAMDVKNAYYYKPKTMMLRDFQE